MSLAKTIVMLKQMETAEHDSAVKRVAQRVREGMEDIEKRLTALEQAQKGVPKGGNPPK